MAGGGWSRSGCLAQGGRRVPREPSMPEVAEGLPVRSLLLSSRPRLPPAGAYVALTLLGSPPSSLGFLGSQHDRQQAGTPQITCACPPPPPPPLPPPPHRVTAGPKPPQVPQGCRGGRVGSVGAELEAGTHPHSLSGLANLRTPKSRNTPRRSSGECCSRKRPNCRCGSKGLWVCAGLFPGRVGGLHCRGSLGPSGLSVPHPPPVGFY